MLRLSCTDCGKLLRVQDETAGKRIRCPACGHSQFVPDVEEAEEAEEEVEEVEVEIVEETKKQQDMLGAQYYRNDARNTIWLIGFLGFIPILILLAILLGGGGSMIKWDAVTFGLTAYSSVLTVISLVAGYWCGQGKKLGRTLAFIPALLLLPSFPLGTIIGIAVIVKINKKDFIANLQ